jgi:hypothetical protein
MKLLSPSSSSCALSVSFHAKAAMKRDPCTLPAAASSIERGEESSKSRFREGRESEEEREKKKLEEKSFHSSLSPNKKKKEETLSLSNQPSFKGAHRSPHDAAAARLRGERGTLSL